MDVDEEVEEMERALAGLKDALAALERLRVKQVDTLGKIAASDRAAWTAAEAQYAERKKVWEDSVRVFRQQLSRLETRKVVRRFRAAARPKKT